MNQSPEQIAESQQKAEDYLREKYGAYRGHFAWREIEESFTTARTEQATEIAALKAQIQGLLDQPEDDGSDWFYKLQFICRVLQGVSPDKTDLQTALGMAQSLRADRWKAEMALLPITRT
jgi:hypothetical protein